MQKVFVFILALFHFYMSSCYSVAQSIVGYSAVLWDGKSCEYHKQNKTCWYMKYLSPFIFTSINCWLTNFLDSAVYINA